MSRGTQRREAVGHPSHFYAVSRKSGSKHIVYIAEQRLSWLPERDPVIESRYVPAREAKRALREMQETCRRMNEERPASCPSAGA
jgi:uncharacterized protein YbcV (DUF1398 family)